MTKARTLADNFAADINGITAGTGITGGGTSGTVTITNDMATTIAAKGDLVVGTANDAYSRLAVASTAGYLLMVDSAEATGLKWAAPAAGGKVLQVVNSMLTSGTFSTTSTSYTDTGLTLTITPSLNTSKIMIFWSVSVGSEAVSGQANTISRYQLLRGTTVLSQKNFAIENNTGASTVIGGSMSIAYYDSPATTSATTYKIQAKQGGLGAVTYMNASTDYPAILTAFEIGA